MLAFFLLAPCETDRGRREREHGLAAYGEIVTNPRYFRSLVSTLTLAVAVTATSLVLATTAGLFLVRNCFRGRNLVVALLTLPLAFPGVVIGFSSSCSGARGF